MSLSMTRENYALHKLHSLTGVVPFGFYMLQHLTLNTFSIGGPEKFNGVIHFFEAMPKHILLGLEIFALWLPMLFHAVYGTVIVVRAKNNYFSTKYKWSENRMFVLQRWTGIFLFAFLMYHVISTTGVKYVQGADTILYAAWQEKLTANGYSMLLLYMLGTLAASYHLAYGIWNFCIRWGITVSDRSQRNVQMASGVIFVVVTLLAWGALGGFLMHPVGAEAAGSVVY